MHIKFTIYRHPYIIFVIIASLLWGCSSPPVRDTQQTTPSIAAEKAPVPRDSQSGVETASPFQRGRISPEVMLPAEGDDPARELINSGRNLDAALLLISVANALPPPQRQDYQLRVVSLLLQGNYIQQADQILNETEIAGLGRDFVVRKSLLAAQLSLAKQAPQQALDRLQILVDDISNANIEQQKEFYRTQMDVYPMLGDFVGSAQSRIMLNTLLVDSEEILENQETLLRDLQNLSPQELQQLESSADNDIMKGWAGLAITVITAQDEQQAKQMIDDWRNRYPDHEVQEVIVETILTQQPEALGRPTQVALILPMTGKFAKAAKAIRDGFFTAYYSQSTDQHRPIIRLYDEGSNADEIESIYQKAIDDGASFVVGPLNKKAVTNLFYSDVLQGGVLSLNYSETDQNDEMSQATTSKNFFQLSLSPEQEAVHVAEHAWLDGHKQAAAIFPETSWGTRVYNAFKSRWEELGGTIVEHQTYNMRKNDYSGPIKQLLNIDESEKRYSDIRRMVKGKVEYEPRRRKDVDFIFMAAFARQGRLLRPQLKFHHASSIPVYATSHVFSGSLEPQMDRDMNGVRFSDMPWTLSNDTKNANLKQQIETTFPSATKRFMRLYALGVDAYNVLPELNRLRRNPFATFQGETGTLFLDVSSRLQRKLLWAQFVKGKPKIIQKF